MSRLVCERAFLVGTRVADKLEGHGAVSLIDTNKGTPLPPPHHHGPRACSITRVLVL